LLIFFFVTAPFLICAVPTLFLGNALIAATLVPPSAMPRETHAMTIAGDGRRRKMRLIVPPLLFES
jgi:hypothetical protein